MNICGNENAFTDGYFFKKQIAKFSTGSAVNISGFLSTKILLAVLNSLPILLVVVLAA